jgi:Cu-Zn family superoxide dismutase
MGETVTLSGASLTGPGTAGVLLDGDGASLVIHASADDNVTDPSGNSGARIACAVIRPVAELR